MKIRLVAAELFHAAFRKMDRRTDGQTDMINPLNAELNPICCLLALLGFHHILHVSRIRVKIIVAFRNFVKAPNNFSPFFPCVGLHGL